jgi:hypothetical protein
VTALRAAIRPYPLLLGLGALDAAGYSVIVPVAPAIAYLDLVPALAGTLVLALTVNSRVAVRPPNVRE